MDRADLEHRLASRRALGNSRTARELCVAAAHRHLRCLVANGVGRVTNGRRLQEQGLVESCSSRLSTLDAVHGVWFLRVCVLELRYFFGHCAQGRFRPDATSYGARIFRPLDGLLLNGRRGTLLRDTCKRPGQRAQMREWTYRWPARAVLRTMRPSCCGALVRLVLSPA